MRVSLKWLADYVDLHLPAEEIAHRLTMAGLEVEAIERTGQAWEHVYVGLVTAVTPHPNADRLRLATVELGGERHTVVCGAPNVAEGQKVAFAKVGARLIDGHTGKPMVLKAATIRGVESAGMVCSEKELGLSEEHEGILVLDPDAPLGAPLADYLGDAILHIDMKPNRSDGLSMLGIAREVAALTGESVREPELTFAEVGPPIGGRVRVTIENPDLCARYVATLIEGVEVRPSPRWMQARLVAAGMRPINNVVDVTNYVMLELGQPLHAFDYDTVSGGHVIVRAAREGERMTTLDGVERTFGPEHLLIADPAGPIAVAGVMGGLHTEVTERTTRVLLESANFNQVSIRRTALALRAQSEASRRFAWGLPAELAMIASRRATKLLVELCGGKAAAGCVDVYPRKDKTVRIEVTRKRLSQVLGVDLPTSKVREALTSLGFGARWVPPDRYVVRVPYWRRDVRIPDDVAEEVARIIGYDQIPTEPIAGPIPPRIEQPVRDLRNRVQDALVAAGMQEIMTYPLTSLETLRRVVPDDWLVDHPPVTIANPLNAGEERLRVSLRASLLQTAAANARIEDGVVALFETARVYLPRDGGQPLEQERVTGVVTGRRPDRWGRPSDESVDFYDAKAYVQALFDALGILVEYEPSEEYGLLPGRTATLRAGGRNVGVLGQVHPQTAAGFDLDRDTYLFDICLDDLLPLLPGPRRHVPVPRFPPVEEDLAVVVDRDVPAARVRAALLAHPLVASAEPFDEYTGPPVPEGRKSLAFALRYQAPDRTLSDADVARVRESLIARLRRELGAELRR